MSRGTQGAGMNNAPVDGLFRSAAGRAGVHDAYRRLIATHLPSLQQHTVRTSAGDTFVLTAGPAGAPAVLLLHGSGSVAASWGPVMTTLGRTHRVHAVDLPGEPGLSAPVRLPLARGVHADWLREVAACLQADVATVAGTSLGAWVGLDYAVAHPAAVRELVLFSPSGLGPRKIGPLLLAAALGALGDRGRRRALGHLLGPGRPPWSDAFHQDLGELALATFRHFRPRTDDIPVFTDEDLRSLPAALTVVLGARDRMLHAERAARRLEQLDIPGTFHLLPGQGHLVPHAPYLQNPT